MTPQQREQLILDNMPLVTYITRKYKHLMDFEELKQYGYLGLAKAAQGFDPSKGFKFSTYAFARVNGEIMKGIAESTHFMALEHHLANDLVKAENFINDFQTNTGREPTLDEMRKVLKFSKEKLLSMLNLLSNPCCLDAKIKDNEKQTYADILQSTDQTPQQELEEKNLSEVLEKVLQILPERNQIIIKHFFGLGVERITQEQLGKKFNVSQKNISHIIKRALKKLKVHAEQQDLQEFLA